MFVLFFPFVLFFSFKQTKCQKSKKTSKRVASSETTVLKTIVRRLCLVLFCVIVAELICIHNSFYFRVTKVELLGETFGHCGQFLSILPNFTSNVNFFKFAFCTFGKGFNSHLFTIQLRYTKHIHFKFMKPIQNICQIVCWIVLGISTYIHVHNFIPKLKQLYQNFHLYYIKYIVVTTNHIRISY